MNCHIVPQCIIKKWQNDVEKYLYECKGLENIEENDIIKLRNLIESEALKIYLIENKMSSKILKVENDRSWLLDTGKVAQLKQSWERDYSVVEELGKFKLFASILLSNDLFLGFCNLIQPYFKKISMNLFENEIFFENEVCSCHLFPMFKERKSYDQWIKHKKIDKVSFKNLSDFPIVIKLS